MRINPFYSNYTVNNYSTKPTKSSFGSNNRIYYTPKGREIATISSMFREDMDWLKLAQYLKENFKDKDNVNVIQYAASDGSEAYTLMIALRECDDKNFSKFLPIKAYDLDKEILKAAKSGFVNMKIPDLDRMRRIISDSSKYFEKADEKLQIAGELFYRPNDYIRTYKVSDDLKNNVEFNQCDMFEHVNEIDDRSNTVVLCRNVLSYWKANTVSEFIENLSEQLKTGSLFITGNLDTDEDGIANYFLKKYGFEQVMANVYRKM